MFSINEVITVEKAKNLNGIVLAFVGDAVYSLFVRQKLTEETDFKSGELNKRASKIVCATAQAEFAQKILPILNEEELAIFKRARNAKKGTRAKSATVSEYNSSTGFEAVLGFLYMTGQYERLDYILNFDGNI